MLFPWLSGFGSGLILSQQGMDINWLNLAFYLFIGIVMSLSFSTGFCIAFLLPFSVETAVLSAGAFTLADGVTFSLMLGLAYGLIPNRAAWGLTAGLTYGVVSGILLGPLNGMAIGAAFLTGYFRIFLYMLEAPLAWCLARFAVRGAALKLWNLNPVLWDELIWFSLPHLDQHLLALKQQNEPAAREAIIHVKKSFRQSRAAEKVKI